MTQRFKGAILSYLYVAVKILVTIIYIPLLLSYLGKNEFGLYQLVGSFFSYITIFETCLSTGVMRYYCNAKASNDLSGMEKILAISRRIYRRMALFLIPFGAICITAFRLVYASSFTKEEINEGSAILVVLFASFIITLLNSVYVTTINANERFVFLKICLIFSQIAQPVITVLLLRWFPKAILVVLVQLSINALIAGANYYYSHKKLGILVKQHFDDGSLTKEILAFSITLLMAAIADQLFWKIDQLVLGKIYDTAAVAIYAIGSQVYMIYMDIGTQIVSVFFPKLSNLYSEKDALNKLSEVFIQVGRIAAIIELLVLSGFILFGKEFIEVWVGPGYEEAYYVAVIVMLPFTVDITQNIGLSILKVTNQYGFRAKMYLTAAIINVFFTIYLAKKFGIVGAAAATAVSMFITSGIIMNVYYCKQVGLDVKRFWSNIGGIIVKTTPVYLIGYLCNSFIGQGSIIILLIKIVAYTILYTIIVVAFVASKEEKRVFHLIRRSN